MTRKNQYNLHHTQFYRAQHESMAVTKEIRRDHRLIVPMWLDPHEELHDNVEMVPAVSVHIAHRALTLFNEKGDAHDPIKNLQNYMRSLDTAAEHPRASLLEREIADAAVWACEQQIIFIQDGYVDLSQYRAA